MYLALLLALTAMTYEEVTTHLAVCTCRAGRTHRWARCPVDPPSPLVAGHTAQTGARTGHAHPGIYTHITYISHIQIYITYISHIHIYHIYITYTHIISHTQIYHIHRYINRYRPITYVYYIYIDISHTQTLLYINRYVTYVYIYIDISHTQIYHLYALWFCEMTSGQK